MRNSRRTRKERIDEPSSWKLLVSFFLILHVVFVSIAVFGNGMTSALFTRLKSGAGLYVEGLNLSPIVSAGFHLTHANGYEDDHHFEVESSETQDVTRLPDGLNQRLSGTKGGFRFQRFRNLTRRAAFAVAAENDVVLAEFARSIGKQFLTPKTTRVSVRLVGYEPEEWQDGAQRDLKMARGAQFYSPIYEADVWRGHRGRINVHKRVPVGEAAPTLSQ